MDGGLLVTGKPAVLLESIAERALDLQANIVITRSGHGELSDTIADSAHITNWNRRSALSARSAVLHAVNLFHSLDTAVVVYAPSRDTSPFHEASVVRIEDRVDAEVKGYLFMIREILSCFTRQGRGTLAMVIWDNEDESRSPVEAAASGSFVSVAEAIFTYYQNEPLSIRGFYATGDDPLEISRFVIDGLAEPASPKKNGRWIRYPSRGGLFRRR
jgi:hypothetical protein